LPSATSVTNIGECNQCEIDLLSEQLAEVLGESSFIADAQTSSDPIDFAHAKSIARYEVLGVPTSESPFMIHLPCCALRANKTHRVQKVRSLSRDQPHDNEKAILLGKARYPVKCFELAALVDGRYRVPFHGGVATQATLLSQEQPDAFI
jgi:hypothetical protein